jgi:hypothetical protein
MKMIAQLRVLVIAPALCATACSPPMDLFDWQKEETLWRDNTGTEFARYAYPRGFLRARSAAYGCESSATEEVVRKRIDLGERTVPRVVGHTAYVFNRDGIAPGWYRLTVNHNLNWWQKNIATFEALAEYTPLDRPVTIPSPISYRSAVFLLEDSALHKVADKKELESLFDVPAEGILYVAEPGIGFNSTLDLTAACR